MCSCMWGGCSENVCPHQLRLINWMLRQLTFILTILKAENLRPRGQQTGFSDWWVSSSGLGDDHVLAVSSHDREVVSFTSLLIRALKWQPTPVFLPGESQGWGAWWAAVYGVAQSQTRLKWLSSSCSSSSKPIEGALFSWSNFLPKAPSSSTITLEVRASSNKLYNSVHTNTCIYFWKKIPQISEWLSLILIV